ncbi:unnamed protein product [Cyclocybe aegerita]|uniref:Uncharacterized protein n=1 Tax=Cyclocybe aegerita TaxID=1973307 RepID=A0A8S0W9H4_CYCAE|nr:unnamed protein product [Cyclocybe aegerita]
MGDIGLATASAGFEKEVVCSSGWSRRLYPELPCHAVSEPLNSLLDSALTLPALLFIPHTRSTASLLHRFPYVIYSRSPAVPRTGYTQVVNRKLCESQSAQSNPRSPPFSLLPTLPTIIFQSNRSQYQNPWTTCPPIRSPTSPRRASAASSVSPNSSPRRRANRTRTPHFCPESEPSSRKAAVLVLLFERDGALRVVLTTRGKDLRTHGGQTSLPGGKMEEGDADMIATAFREAHEEVALPLPCPHVHTLGRLELHPFHKLIVTPVVALVTDSTLVERLVAATGEVDHIFSHPLEAMVDPELAEELEELVPRGEHWPHGPCHHDFKDYYNVASLGNTSYRWHFFRSSATAVTGLTADILIRTAQIAYDTEPKYERYAPNQLRTFEEMEEAFKKEDLPKIRRSVHVPSSHLLISQLLQTIGIYEFTYKMSSDSEATLFSATMPVTIRRAKECDESALSRICLLTADAGVSAEPLHDFGELPGLVYAVPYVKLPTTWGFVLEDDATNEVVGYILGSTDTRAYERYAAEHWWPPLAEKYPPEKMTKPGDQHYSKLLRNMHTAPDANIAFSPAHLHIDILGAYQNQGWGRKLIAAAMEFLGGEGIDGVWLGLDPRNEGARKFYTRLGFGLVEGAPDNNQMGLKFADFKV